MDTNASWLKDGVEAIEMVVERATHVVPAVLPLPQEKPGTYGLFVPGKPGDKLGDLLTTKVAGPLWHNEQLADVNNLVAFVENKTKAQDTKTGVIYVGPDAVQYVYDSHDRRDRATCVLELSEPWKLLSKPIPPLEQKAIIRLLRINFNGCLHNGSTLIETMREIKFDAQGSIESKVNHGNASLGKKLSAAITGVNSIPDEFPMVVQVFKNFPFKVQILCALEIHTEVAKFEIVPYPNQLEDALAQTLEQIRLRFESTDVPAYVGAVKLAGQQ